VITARYLDPHDSRDAAYIAGQPTPGKGERYAGIFVELANETGQSKSLPSVSLTDAAGTEHAAYPPPSGNPYLRHFGETIGPHETQPASDSTHGPPVRSLLLFRLIPGSEKRPYTLHIESEGGKGKLTLRGI